LFGIGNFTDDSIKLSKDCNVGKFVCLSKHDELYNLNTDTSQESTNRICSAKYNVINVRDKIDSSLGEGQINDLQNLINEYEDVFAGKDGKLGKCSLLKHKIEVPEGTRPVRQRAYKVGPKQKEILENMVKDMIDQDIIEESCSPWGAPCMLVAKRNNNGYRFVVDFRLLNTKIILGAHPLPTTIEALESLGSNAPAYCSTIDLPSGFYQLEINPISRPLTACHCHLGLFQFKRLPMGLKNSPLTFQRVMEAVLRGLNWKFSLVYLDDIIVFIKTFSDHLSHLRQIFDRLRTAGLKLHPAKCSFA
jgi:hypothetical protein